MVKKCKRYDVITKRGAVTGISPHKSKKGAEKYVRDYKKLAKKNKIFKGVKISIKCVK